METYKKIIELQNDVEAGLMDSILIERDIPHYIRSYHDSAYDGIFQLQMGWGHVEAPERWREEIETIYTDIKESGDTSP